MPAIRTARTPPASPYAAHGETPRDAKPWMDVGSYSDMVVMGPMSPRPPPAAGLGSGTGLGSAPTPHGSVPASPSRSALAPLLSGGFGVTQRFYPGPNFGGPASGAGGGSGGGAPVSPRGSLSSVHSTGHDRMVLPQV